jgi:hypothetical protein
MSEHTHLPPAVVAICFTADEAFTIESLLTGEGFLCVTDAEESRTRESRASTPSEILTIYVPGAQAREARELVATARRPVRVPARNGAARAVST